MRPAHYLIIAAALVVAFLIGRWTKPKPLFIPAERGPDSTLYWEGKADVYQQRYDSAMAAIECLEQNQPSNEDAINQYRGALRRSGLRAVRDTLLQGSR